MRLRRSGNTLTFIILVTLVACQPTLVAPATPTMLPTTAVPALQTRPTQTPRVVATVTATDPPHRPTPTPWPSAAALASGEALPSGTLDPALLAVIAARVSGDSAGSGETVIGRTVGGRELRARSFGSGERVVLLVGGMHGGWEANTVTLMGQLIDHFEQTPDDVLDGVTVVIVPVVNADGLILGRTPEGRFNTNGVDLNRNWGCDWSPDAVWRKERVNPGPNAFSEPETQALSDFILRLRPTVALFYHSATNGVFAGHCRGDHGSAALSALYGEATGYRYDLPFTAYAVSGTASEWADGQGIPSADVELSSPDGSEFERNLRGLTALQRWLVGLKP